MSLLGSGEANDMCNFFLHYEGHMSHLNFSSLVLCSYQMYPQIKRNVLKRRHFLNRIVILAKHLVYLMIFAMIKQKVRFWFKSFELKNTVNTVSLKIQNCGSNWRFGLPKPSTISTFLYAHTSNERNILDTEAVSHIQRYIFRNYLKVPKIGVQKYKN